MNQVTRTKKSHPRFGFITKWKWFTFLLYDNPQEVVIITTKTDTAPDAFVEFSTRNNTAVRDRSQQNRLAIGVPA